jgi:hypothetical protein
MDNRLKIRKLERLLGLKVTPLKTDFETENHVKRMSVRNSSEFNPNYNYLS